MKKIVLCLCVIIISACGVSNKMYVAQIATPLPPTTFVEVIGANVSIAPGAKMLGSGNVTDSGMTATRNCTYAKVVEQAQANARTMGGDLIVITDHIEPTFIVSSCHRIKYTVYKKP